MTENQQKTELAEQLEEYKKEELVWQKKESSRFRLADRCAR